MSVPIRLALMPSGESVARGAEPTEGEGGFSNATHLSYSYVKLNSDREQRQ